MLKSYFAKASHDKDVVKKLMELSWRVRREEIQKKPGDILDIQDRYPYLSEKEYVS